MAAADFELLLSPIQSIRIDVSQMLSVMKSAAAATSSARAGIGDAGAKLSRTISSATDRMFKDFKGAKGKQFVKSFQQRLQDAVTKTFSRKNTKDKFLKDFNKQFQTSLTKSQIQSLRSLYKSGQFDKLRSKFIDVSKSASLRFKQGIETINFDQIIDEFYSGIKSQSSKMLSWMPDIFRKPLNKVIDNWTKQSAQKTKKFFNQSPRLQQFVNKVSGFLKQFGKGLAVVGLFVGGIVTMFRGIQRQWTKLNKQFGRYLTTFDKFRKSYFDFAKYTGMSLKQFGQAATGVVRQFGFLDKQATQTSAQLVRVMGLSTQERRKLQRVIGGPDRSVKKRLDEATKSIIKFGGHGKIVFQTVIRLQDKFRTLTDKQRKDFIDLASQLTSMGVDSKVIMENLTEGFGSIDKALQTTKQANLAILQMSLNAGKTFNMVRATAAIDIYKRTRVGDFNKAFDILSKQVGPDFIKSFKNITSVAAKQNFLKTYFGDVQTGQKLMDQWRQMINVFGTKDIQAVKNKFSGIFIGTKQQQKNLLDAFGNRLKQMAMDSTPQIQAQLKKALSGDNAVIAQIKAEVQMKVKRVKSLQDMQRATTGLAQNISKLWQSFKAGFASRFLPFVQGLNSMFAGIKGTKRTQTFFALGQRIGFVATLIPKFVAVLSIFSKFIAIAGIFGKVFISVAKFLNPLGYILLLFQSIFTYAQYVGKTTSIIQKFFLAIISGVDALLSPFRQIINLFAKGTRFQVPKIAQLIWGKGRATGDVVKATPGGVPRTVGEGGKDQIISPVPLMQSMVDKAVRGASQGSKKLQQLISQNNELLKQLINKIDKPQQISGKLRLDGDIAHVVSSQLRYAIK